MVETPLSNSVLLLVENSIVRREDAASSSDEWKVGKAPTKRAPAALNDGGLPGVYLRDKTLLWDAMDGKFRGQDEAIQQMTCLRIV